MVVLYQDGMVGMECLLCDLVGFRAFLIFSKEGRGWPMRLVLAWPESEKRKTKDMFCQGSTTDAFSRHDKTPHKSQGQQTHHNKLETATRLSTVHCNKVPVRVQARHSTSHQISIAITY